MESYGGITTIGGAGCVELLPHVTIIRNRREPKARKTIVPPRLSLERLTRCPQLRKLNALK